LRRLEIWIYLELNFSFSDLPQVKVILVTGGAGFIGSNFINFWMDKSPQDVIVNFDCLEAHSNLRNIENPGGENYTFVRGNLLDKACVEEVFERRRFTHIVHFAAASNVDQSFIKPVSCTLSNVLGTHNLLEAARNCGSLKLFLLISTDEVYGETPSGDCLEEGSVFCPTNPYAASKAAAECLVMAYGKSYKMPWIITRSNNVYGKYQFPTQALPKFLTCLLTGQKMPIHGDGKMRRKFIHVQDKCRALQILIDRGSLAEVYNIGTSDELTVLELCQVLLKNVLGPGHELSAHSN
jgi:dTDP-glucose 4,6-dehydratase